jgi:crossover junction endonuclease MUS81
MSNQTLTDLIAKLNATNCQHIKLIVDTREQTLLQYLQTLKIVETSQLSIGDIHIIVNDQLLFVIERKTTSDFNSSIKDGRFRNQKNRLIELNISNNSIVYLLEQDTGFDPQNVGKKSYISYTTLKSAELNILFRDNMKIVYSSSIAESAFILLSLINKILENKIKINTEIVNTEKSENTEELKTCNYLNTLKGSSKKDNLTPERCYIYQLSSITGVSVEMANAIFKEYPSFIHLSKAYINNDVKTGELLLSNILYTTKTDNNRKIGKVISKRIYNYTNF